MRIKWTNEALIRLFEIEDFISQDSLERAEKFVDQIIEHAETLSDKPLRGRTVSEISCSRSNSPNRRRRDQGLWQEL